MPIVRHVELLRPVLVDEDAHDVATSASVGDGMWRRRVTRLDGRALDYLQVARKT